ncbi:MAG: hypothetical protein KGL29_04725 [Alphaproteobacteria bacterium]|nr:hypothetical protein [Alphaproteobacteria bacterium]
MRILIAGALGALAMFLWTSIAHVATPLATAGFSKMQNEAVVLNAMKQGVGAAQGLYFFPWVDPDDPKMMEKSAALMKTNPAGLLIYTPPGTRVSMTPMLIEEFVKELAQSLIAAFLLSMVAIAGYFRRVLFVTLIGAFAVLGTDVSYWIWYGFPLSYTLAAMTIELVGAFAAGLVIAWWMGRRRSFIRSAV